MIKLTKIVKIVTVLALLTSTILMYKNLGRDYLFDWDESIYAELGVETKNITNLVTPTWNDSIWLEKPPLVSWLAFAGSHLVKDPELGARFFMPIFALITLIATYQIGVIITNPVGATIAVSMLGYFNLFLSRTRTLNTDILLLSGIMILVLTLLKKSKPIYPALALSFAIFAKGPAGLMAILIASPILAKQSKKYLLRFTLLSLAIILPWHLYQLIVNGADFYTPYLLEQVFRRATVPIEFHLESRWFYFVSLYKDLGLGVLLVSTIGLFVANTKSRFLIAWQLIPLIIFTLAKTRLSWYILPIYPAIALSIAVALTRLAKTSVAKSILQMGAIFAALNLVAHSYAYIEPKRTVSNQPDQLIVAQAMSALPNPSLAFLVSPSERVAEAILPSNQRISSSFRYGGAPSVVFYSHKKVTFYYNYEQFQSDLSSGIYDLAIITKDDVEHLPADFKPLIATDSYIGYVRKNVYAQR